MTSDPNPSTPPPDMGRWVQRAVLGDWRAPKWLTVDVDDNWWLSNSSTGPAAFMLTRAEAIDLCERMCSTFGLVVINEPEQWGNDTEVSRCECDRVPSDVTCGDCGADMVVGDPRNRADWETRA